MRRSVQRKTVYAMTLVTVLALAGAWTFAATLITQNPPPQSSSITVIAPGQFTTATVQSTGLVTVTGGIVALTSSAPAGVQAAPGQAGLQSSYTNAVLPSCPAPIGVCGGNYSAVDVAHALAVGDTSVQVVLQVQQTGTASGFDVQVELMLVGSPDTYVFGNAYFDTGTTTVTPSATVWVTVFIDTGVSAITPPSLDHVVVTMNACQQAATCP
jgi:hypothetical protein